MTSLTSAILDGALHALTNWDVLLILAALAVLAGRPRRLIIAWTVLTVEQAGALYTATLAEWQLHAATAEIMLIVGAVVIGLFTMRGRPHEPAWLFPIAILFGCLHGLGLSTEWQHLGQDMNGLGARVSAFSLGLSAVAMMAVAAFALAARIYSNQRQAPIGYRAPAARARLLSGVLIAVAVLLLPQGLSTAASVATSRCGFQDTPPLATTPDGVHPAKTFYSPGEPVAGDVRHLVDHGYLVLQYNPALSRQDVKTVQDYVTQSEESRIIALAATAPSSPAFRATGFRRTLACDDVDLSALRDLEHTQDLD